MTDSQGRVSVNGMAVLEADVETRNGQLYSLDGVLVPASVLPVLPHRCDKTETRVVQVGLCRLPLLCGCFRTPLLFPLVLPLQCGSVSFYGSGAVHSRSTAPVLFTLVLPLQCRSL